MNARGEFWAASYPGKLNAEAFVAFLQNFIDTQPGKVFLVVDGDPAHKANVVKAYLKSLQGRLELHFLPPYAPDLNPDEFCLELHEEQWGLQEAIEKERVIA